MHFFSYTEKWIFKADLNLNVITPLLCMSTEIKSQEDKSTAGHDIILEQSFRRIESEMIHRQRALGLCNCLKALSVRL